MMNPIAKTRLRRDLYLLIERIDKDTPLDASFTLEVRSLLNRDCSDPVANYVDTYVISVEFVRDEGMLAQ